jgi:hypothetical protein
MMAAMFVVPGTAMADQVPVVDSLGNPISIDYFGNTVSLARDDSGIPMLVDQSGNPVSMSVDQSGNPILVDQSGNPVSDQSGNPITQNDLANALCSLNSQEANALLVPGCSS